MQQPQNIFLKKQPKAWWIHAAVWVAFYALLILYSIHKWDEIFFPFAKATIAITFYLLATYTNYLWLLPKLFKDGKLGHYLILAALFLIFICIIRSYLEYLILFPIHKTFYNFSTGQIALVSMTNMIAFGFGGLVYITADYMNLLKKQEELKRRQTDAELALLKSQVQPHFLFNTLNNLYYLAYTHHEKTPQVIAKLSDIMRYFVDEAPKEKVKLSKEVNFLRNYIDLETMRMVNPLQLEFREEVEDNNLLIPPMLLIPSVENIFKHGVDKTQACNEANIYLQVNNKYLLFRVQNRVHEEKANINKKGGGIHNLHQRLKILYGNNYELYTQEGGGYFTTQLKIPIEL